MKKQIASLILMIALLCSLNMPILAHEVPDPEQECSIEIEMRHGGDVISGGTLTIYQVGEVFEEDGNYSFVPLEAFLACTDKFDDITSADLADELASFAAENNYKGTTKTIDKNGKVSFSDLNVGLYLLVQKKAADGYNKVNAFLVSVPQMKDGKYVYHVDASPKVELIPTDHPPETTPPTNHPPDTKLPQTGQLNWPIPVLVVSGLGLFMIGWAMRFRGRTL